MSIIKSKVALVAIGIASVVLAGSIAPAAAGKGKHGGHHGKHDNPPQNPGPIGPLPKPPAPPVIGQDQWHAAPTPVVVRDHRPQPIVRDHQKKPDVRDHRASAKTSEKKVSQSKNGPLTTCPSCPH
ncbi:MAG: hypothetical protein K8F62_04655 [Pseudorhodoplanes sp.]|nr:hypothetical protein [Pseudorhodoplanes sp.]